MSAIQNGDKVAIHYRGTLESGEEFDNSEGRKPLEFTAGGDELIPGMSKAVIGMQTGEKKTVTVPPDEAYGPRREELQIKVDREQLPEGVDVGAMLGLSTPDGQFHAVLVELAEDHGILDGNHPLAGKTLVFELEVVSIG